MGDTAKILRFTLALCVAAFLGACGKEPPSPSVDEFMQDPILLDATMVRCVANRNSVNYEAECINAREAVERIAAAREKARRDELEAESVRKREALRRTREAIDEVRRRAAEAARLREQDEYLGLAPAPATPEGDAPDTDELSFIDVQDGAPGATVTVPDVPVPAAQDADAAADSAEASTGGEEKPLQTDLGEIREQLEQRQQTPPESSDP